MNIEVAKEKFNSFVLTNYSLDNPKINHKYHHTFDVVDFTKLIFESLKLNEIDTELALIIALLHDIGRFDQAIKTNNFMENDNSYDHAKLGVESLFNNNEIRNYIKTAEYDEIIKKSILFHSRYELDNNLTERELMFCKILRDADKLANFKAKKEVDVLIMSNMKSEDIEDSLISDSVYNSFKNCKLIKSSDRITGIDVWLSNIAFIFDLYYQCSLKYIKDNDYVNILFNKYNYHKEYLKINELKKVANDYLDKEVNNERNC